MGVGIRLLGSHRGLGLWAGVCSLPVNSVGMEAVAGVAAGDAFQSRFGGVVGSAFQNSLHDFPILLGFQRAGGVDQQPIGRQAVKSVCQEGFLLLREILKVLGAETPLDVRVASQSSGTGAGGINEDAVELRPEGQRRGGVEGDCIDAHCRQAA